MPTWRRQHWFSNVPRKSAGFNTTSIHLCITYNGLNALGSKRSVWSLDLFKEEHTGVALKFSRGLGESSEGKMSVLQT